MAFQYQWRRCDATGGSCVDVTGATSTNYVLSNADLGSTIRVVVSDGVTTGTSDPTAVIGAAPTPPPPASSIYWSFRGDGAFYQKPPYNIADGSDAPFCVGDAPPTAYTEFVAHAGKAPTAIHWGGSGTSISAFDSTADTKARSVNAFSYYSMAASAGQLTDLRDNVNSNGGLTAIDNWATAAKAAGRPIMLRPLWEMNGNWGYLWQTGSGARLTAAQYRTVWQRIWHRVADIMGGHTPGSGLGTSTGNVSFCWCPNVMGGTVPDPTGWFPGVPYVDWMMADGYNKGGSGDSPSALFNPVFGVERTLAPGLPIGIGETGCEAPTSYPGGKTQWVIDFFTYVKANTDIKFFNWFNEAGSPLLPHIEVGPAATTFGGATQAAWAAQIADAYFKANIVTPITFPSGAKVPIP